MKRQPWMWKLVFLANRDALFQSVYKASAVFALLARGSSLPRNVLPHISVKLGPPSIVRG